MKIWNSDITIEMYGYSIVQHVLFDILAQSGHPRDGVGQTFLAKPTTSLSGIREIRIMLNGISFAFS